MSSKTLNRFQKKKEKRLLFCYGLLRPLSPLSIPLPPSLSTPLSLPTATCPFSYPFWSFTPSDRH
jgi:hypothetical protein